MITNDQPGTHDPRFKVWIGGTVFLFIIAVGVGFVWLPSAQRGQGELDIWGVICRAIGVPSRGPGASAPAGAEPASTIAWTTATRQWLKQGDAVRGGELASTCNGCHGANGVSADAIFPNLVGQSVAAIYKQLEDFKSGKRNAVLMGVYVAPLTEQDMLDLATHFASLSNPYAHAVSRPDFIDSAARHLIEVGNPLRNIAPCAACHGPLGVTPGAPELRGQQRAYLEEQMLALAAGSRRNDISKQMRSVAGQLTGEEIAFLSAFYAGMSGAPAR